MHRVFDNFLPQSMQDHLEIAFKDPGLPWLWQDNTSGFQEWELNYLAQMPNIKESPQFVHTVIDPQNQIQSHTWEMVKPIFYFLEKECGLVVKDISRVKANLMIPDGRDPKAVHNPPHIDSPHESSLSMIYYTHDCDGATRLFKQGVQDGIENLELEHECEPKKGRVFMFNSNQFHASCNPSTEHARRVIVNFVFNPQNAIW